MTVSVTYSKRDFKWFDKCYFPPPNWIFFFIVCKHYTLFSITKEILMQIIQITHSIVNWKVYKWQSFQHGILMDTAWHIGLLKYTKQKTFYHYTKYKSKFKFSFDELPHRIKLVQNKEAKDSKVQNHNKRGTD